jgi:hypothetical protein
MPVETVLVLRLGASLAVSRARFADVDRATGGRSWRGQLSRQYKSCTGCPSHIQKTNVSSGETSSCLKAWCTCYKTAVPRANCGAALSLSTSRIGRKRTQQR